MKLYRLMLLSLIASGSVYAQIAPRIDYVVGANALYQRNVTGNSQTVGSWKFPATSDYNETDNGGTAAYAIGGDDLKHIFIKHNISGGVVQYNTGNGNDFGAGVTLIDAYDETTIVGLSATAPNNNNAANPVSALTLIDTPADSDLGDFKITEGIWQGGSAVELNTSGRGSYDGGYLNSVSAVEIYGSSFAGGIASGTGSGNNYGGNGIRIFNADSVTISNHVDDLNQFYRGGNSGSSDSSSAQSARSISGGEGAALSAIEGDVNVHNGNYYGGGNADGSIRSFTLGDYNCHHATIYADGGTAFSVMNATNFYLDLSGEMIAGDAGNIDIIGPMNTAYAFGGYGLYAEGISSITDITGGTYRGGVAGSAFITSASLIIDVPSGDDIFVNTDGTAYSHGGSGIYLNDAGEATISGDVDSKGGKAGVAWVNGLNSYSYASGGSGIRAVYSDKLTINSGNFAGSQGGRATVSDDDPTNIAIADGGSGVQVIETDLIINGGTYSGAKAGTATGPRTQAINGHGVWAVESDVTINNNSTVINDGIYFESYNTLGIERELSLNGGSIIGDITLNGISASKLLITSGVEFEGTLHQIGGTANVEASSPDALEIFSDVLIESTMNLNASSTNILTTAQGATYTLASSAARLNVNGAGLQLANNATINNDLATVTIAGDLVLDSGASVNLGFGYNGANQTSGLIDLGANQLTATNIDSRIALSGISQTTTGTVEIVKSGALDFGGNNIEEIISVDLGWLTKTDNFNTNSGVIINYGYNSLTNNSSLSDIDEASLSIFDTMLQDTNNSSFFVGLNSISAHDGANSVRFTASQEADMAESAFQLQNMVTEQFANRGADFRSINGFASSKTSYSPAGVAGPKLESGLEGWIKAYGSFSSRDKESTYTDYDSSTWGTVIGIDKSFNHLLIGVAGGYGRSDIDAGEIYKTKVNTYHGSAYSTLGNENLFVDLAATYAVNDAETTSTLSPITTIDGYSASGYIGAGMLFDVKETISITPEASMLATYYSQEGYNRQIMTSASMSVDEYEEWSYLGSLGLNLASSKRVDWNNVGLAVVPEVRVHWLHEFNPDMEDINFTSGGSSGVLGVRPRDEDMLQIGLGLDLWNWKLQRTTFEIDYDALLGETFMSHTVSGKISYTF